MATTISGTSGVTYPAGGLDNTVGAGVGTTDTQTLTNKTLGSGLVAGASLITSGTVVASTSGTSIPFTGIPSWVKRITVMFSGVSTNGTAAIQVQLGTGVTPTYTIAGYSSIVGTLLIPSTAGAGLYTTGFGIAVNVSATTYIYGSIILTNLTSNTWVEQGVTFTRNDSVGSSAGSIALAAVLTAVRVIASATGSPVDAFDGGSINILYE